MSQGNRLLFNDQQANDTSDPAKCASPVSVFVEGDFDGATITLSVSRTENGAYVDIENTTVAAVINVDINGIFYLKAALTDAGGSTSITVALN